MVSISMEITVNIVLVILMTAYAIRLAYLHLNKPRRDAILNKYSSTSGRKVRTMLYSLQFLSSWYLLIVSFATNLTSSIYRQLSIHPSSPILLTLSLGALASFLVSAYLLITLYQKLNDSPGAPSL